MIEYVSYFIIFISFIYKGYVLGHIYIEHFIFVLTVFVHFFMYLLCMLI